MIRIPDDLKPAGGRFGSGPSKVPVGAVSALADVGGTLLGTSQAAEPDKVSALTACIDYVVERV